MKPIAEIEEKLATKTESIFGLNHHLKSREGR